MAKLKGIIPQQAFELIRDRIGEVLADELAGQNVLTGNADLRPNVWIERSIPFDKTEMPAINIRLPNGSWDNEDMRSSDGTYSYTIDIYTSAVTTIVDGIDVPGDQASLVKLQRIMGMVRAILKNPVYRTLGFQPGFIGHSTIGNFVIADPETDDALSTVIARMEYSVRAQEYIEFIEPVLISGHSTVVKLGLTQKGYVWEYENQSGNIFISETGNLFISETGDFFITEPQ